MERRGIRQDEQPLHMDQEPEVISRYTDAQALEDGVLVAVDFAPVNRVTRSVFDYFARPIDTSPAKGAVIDITPVRKVIEAMLAVESDDGWRSGIYEGKNLWLIPNEVKGLTLMFPEDY